jgi:hypothetical protein
MEKEGIANKIIFLNWIFIVGFVVSIGIKLGLRLTSNSISILETGPTTGCILLIVGLCTFLLIQIILIRKYKISK